MTTPTTLSCDDSPLSVTANIVGILTFSLGLLASYIALQTATRGAPSEIARLVDDLRSTQSEINRVAEYIFDDAHRDSIDSAEKSASTRAVSARFLGSAKPSYAEGADSIGSESSSADKDGNFDAASGVNTTAIVSGNHALYEETQALLASCIRLFYEADSLLKQSQSDHARWDPEGLRRRIVFVMNRHEVVEKMQRLAEQKQKLGSVQMSLFMRKSAAQDGLLKEMSRRLEDLEGRLKKRNED